MSQKIPKIIHYCWFGGASMPELARKCIKSWEKYCPDYEIKCWNEDNFDLNCNAYVREAYDAKKWAFVTDVARLHALVSEGGFYLDTDVELLKSLDDLLQYEAISGFESANKLQTGVLACIKGHEFFRDFLADYKDRRFILEDGRYDVTTNAYRITQKCLEIGLELNGKQQVLGSLTLVPCEYFCPKDWASGEVKVSANTYAIHHFSGSWMPPANVFRHNMTNRLARYMSRERAERVADFLAKCKYEGIGRALGWKK